jgi:hypothetical protein
MRLTKADNGVVEFRDGKNKLLPIVIADEKVFVAIKDVGINLLVVMADSLPLMTYKGRKKVFTPMDTAIRWHKEELKHDKDKKSREGLIERMVDWKQVALETPIE